jgi:hypothetical protein
MKPAMPNNETYEVHDRGKTLSVELWYPRVEDGRPNAVEVGLCDVRAADSVRLYYDFERDGWAIQQATRFRWEADEEPDPKWTEVAFVQAWGSDSEPDED